ncbi:MAG: cupin domain-containing protein [Candidatus Eisenbacteria bacterium]
MPTKTELGRRLREERVRRTLTLKDVEKRSGVSATHISQIERGITWPTVNALNKVATALEKKTSFFLEEVELADVCRLSGDGSTMLISEDPRLTLKTMTNGIPGGQLHFYKLIVEPAGDNTDFARLHCHEGDECGWVVSGKVELKVGDELFELGEGDTVHFNGNKPHGIRNIGDRVSESVWAAFSLGI